MLATVALLACATAAAAAQGPPPRLRVSGNPGALVVSTAVAGAQPTAITNAVTTYDVRVASSAVMKITARLSAPTPPGVTLTVTLAAPAGATSLGPVTLDATARDVVINITGVNSTHAITFQLTSTTGAGVIAPASRTVTFDLVTYP